MNRHFKSITSITTLAFLSIAATCNATAAERSSDYRTQVQIRACIEEISRRADYARASRIIHWVAELQQKNLAELEITAVTSVYRNDHVRPAREYAAVCVTDTGGQIIRFSLRELE